MRTLRQISFNLLVLSSSVVLSSYSYASSRTDLVDEPVNYTQSDFGGVGLLQVPTARMAPDGHFSVSFSHVSPYNRTAISAQVMPWLEGTVRYTAITNRKYSNNEEFSGDQSYKDRGFDVKLRLWEESEYLPEVSVAMHDFAGTGLFGSEYVVASKKYYNWDFTLGLAWGNGGAAGGIKNPFTLISDKFETRDEYEAGESGGDVNFGNYFSGEEVAPVAGVEYSSYGSDWAYKIELDGNDYQSEGLENSFSHELPINVGVTYRYNDLFRFKVGFERGDTVMAGLEMGLNFGSEDALMPKFDNDPVAYDPNSAKGISNDLQVKNLKAELQEEKIKLKAFELSEDTATIHFSQKKYRNAPRALGRASRILINHLPETVSSYRFVEYSANLPLNSVEIPAAVLRDQAKGKASGAEVLAETSISEYSEEGFEDAIYSSTLSETPSWDWRIRPIFSPSFGAPEGFIIYKLWLKLAADFQLTDNLSLNNVFSINLHNNYDKLDQPSDSVLPHVRSDVKEYAAEGENSIQRMQLDYIWKPFENTYARASTGIFESMYGGVSGEVLYKPIDSRLAVGLDINYVKQRDYDQLFTFRDYTATTGHLTFYYEAPIKNVLVKLSGGQYLAEDKGATLDLSRKFDTGVVLGAWATKTNVSSEDFGEGSFDKGLYIKFPLDLFFVESRKDSLMASWRPLTRDGGQKVMVGNRLYSHVSDNDLGQMSSGWGEFGQ